MGFFLHAAILIGSMLIFIPVKAQQLISVSAEGKPLSDVLQEISDVSGIRFAYDAVSFKEIQVAFSFSQVTAEHFLEYLSDHYRIDSKQVEGTWLLMLQKSSGIQKEAVKKPPVSTVRGYVHDRQTGENLIFCNLAADENRGGMTNELGYFNFPVPEADSVRVLVSHLGYRRLDTVVSVADPVVFSLIPSSVMVDPVKVVHYEKDVLQASPRPEKIAFNPLKASALPRIASDDLGNALLLIPGIEFFQGGLSGLSVRGSEPTDNLVLFDGIPVLETSHLLGNMSVLNAKFVQQAFVSRGGFDVTYGGRVAGLIELTGKSGKNNTPYLDVSANLLNTNVLASLPVTDKFSVTAAWRRSFIDSWQNFLYFRLIDDVISSEENQVTSTIIPVVKFQDVNAKVSFHPAENFNADINVLYGTDDQSRDFELLQTQDFYRNERLKSQSAGFSFNMNWQSDPRWFHAFSSGYASLEKKTTDETGELQTITEIIENPGKGQGKGKGIAKTRENTYLRETYDFDNGFNRVNEFRISWRSQFKKGIVTSDAGTGLTANRYAYDFLASRLYDVLQVDSISSSNKLSLLNVFVQQVIEPVQSLRFRWGIRGSFHAGNSKMYWQPRGGIEFLPDKDLKLYFLSGMYYQFLSGIRRFDSEGHYSRIWYLPDARGAGVVSGSHYILGGKLEKNGWYADLEAYHKNAQGKMNLFAEYNRQDEDQVVSYMLRESKERRRGIDLFLQKKHFIFNHMAGYSLSLAEEKMNGFFGGNWFPGYNDRTQRLKLTEMIRWRKWTVTGSWQYATGLPVYRYIPDRQVDGFTRSGKLSQMNVAVVKSFVNAFFSLSTGASLLNVFNRQNVVEVNYLRFSSDTGSMTVRSDISALGITPVFFMNVKF